VDGIDRTYHVLRDATTGTDGKRVAAFVEKGQGMDRIYLVYPALMGEMKAGPEGESNPF
jgi:hypothetical protein